jgi:hypothetical protein
MAIAVPVPDCAGDLATSEASACVGATVVGATLVGALLVGASLVGPHAERITVAAPRSTTAFDFSTRISLSLEAGRWSAPHVGRRRTIG